MLSQDGVDEFGMPKYNTNRRGSQGSRVDRIDPTQIPRPAEAKVGSRVAKFYTRSGAVPPSATSDYVAIDEGNCSPRFIRMTTNQVRACVHVCVCVCVVLDCCGC
jgi:hypothetical protein